MEHATASILYWTPRVLGCLFAGFVALFALDAFDGKHGAGGSPVAFAIHLIPAAIVLAVVLVAWYWSWAGPILLGGLGTWYVITTWGRMHWSAPVVIAGPCFLLALLFLADALHRSRLGTG
ncbi:DUF7670 domain-containing protein [Aquisphaera insulae]|uniref:DUF7670 domain-containing protein n=1 Tax=Aquisphaera insulae TaxID=2712864 RepID=UPI0013ECA7A8|nr:hypothetical protein [Aquisphaera insulae]